MTGAGNPVGLFVESHTMPRESSVDPMTRSRDGSAEHGTGRWWREAMTFIAHALIALVQLVTGFYGFWLVWRVLLPALPGPPPTTSGSRPTRTTSPIRSSISSLAVSASRSAPLLLCRCSRWRSSSPVSGGHRALSDPAAEG